MKTKLTLLLLVLTTLSAFSNKRTTSKNSALSDYNLEQLIISTYPGIDADKDGSISIGEANGTKASGNLPSSLTLNFSYATFVNNGIDFTGFEHFEIRNFRLIGAPYQGKYIKIFNLDLSKLGGVLQGNVRRVIGEFYLSGLQFTSLNLPSARPIAKLYFHNCGSSSNLEQLPNMPDYPELETIEIYNTSLFATLNLGIRNSLKSLYIRNIYIEGIDLTQCTALQTLFVEGAGELKNVTLPTVKTELKNITINGMPKLNALDIDNYSNLETLVMQTGPGFPNTNITTLNFQNKTKLKTLKLENLKSLSSASLLQNTALTELLLVGINNNIALLDISNQTQLKKLTLSANAIPVLDLSKNTALEYFDGFNSGFTKLTFGANTNLKELLLSSNKLTSIDTKNFSNLERLQLDDNLLTTLDVSSNSKLFWVRCQRNSNLRIANIANGNNANMNEWDFKAAYLDQNPKLTCILVDANVQKKIPEQWQKDQTSSYVLDDEIGYQDANFKSELLNYPEKIDLDTNGKICTCEAESYKGTLDLSNKGIQNMNGLEAFKNITGLNVNNNNISTLNVSPNSKLTYLYANSSNINIVSIENLGELDDLTLSKNNLNSITFKGNLKLTKVNVSDNKLTGLSTSQLNKLYLLDCTNNEISSLDVSSNPNLEILYCGNNKFISLATQPTTIDLSNNTKLKQFNAKGNALTEIDISSNPDITEFIVSNNKLTKLNVANSNNANINSFDASGNTNLSCIQIDSNFTPPNSWLRDGNTNFSNNCTTASTDDVYLQSLIKVYPNPFSNKISITNNTSKTIENVQLFNLLGKKVKTSTKKHLDVSTIDRGVYFLKVKLSSGKILYKKMLKN